MSNIPEFPSLPPDTFLAQLDIKICQESDSCQPHDEGQALRVYTDDAGGGPFIVIETDRWALDDMAAFAQFLQRIYDLAGAIHDTERPYRPAPRSLDDGEVLTGEI